LFDEYADREVGVIVEARTGPWRSVTTGVCCAVSARSAVSPPWGSQPGDPTVVVGLRYTSRRMSDASEALPGDLVRTLEQIARAVGEVSPGNDVFEPQGLVHRWMAALESADRGRFLTLLSADQGEVQLASIARSVVSGATAWPAAAPASAGSSAGSSGGSSAESSLLLVADLSARPLRCHEAL